MQIFFIKSSDLNVFRTWFRNANSKPLESTTRNWILRIKVKCPLFLRLKHETFVLFFCPQFRVYFVLRKFFEFKESTNFFIIFAKQKLNVNRNVRKNCERIANELLIQCPLAFCLFSKKYSLRMSEEISGLFYVKVKVVLLE